MRHINISAFGLTLLVAAAPAMAEEPAGPPKEAKELHCLAGSWTGKGVLEMGADKIPVQGQYKCEKAAAGFGLSCVFEMTGLPGMTYVEHDLWGYDPGDGSYHWFSITNGGETHDHKGRITKDAFIGRYAGKREGKPMTEDIKVQFTSNDTIEMSSVVTVGGQPAERLTFSMRKGEIHADRK